MTRRADVVKWYVEKSKSVEKEGVRSARRNRTFEKQ
jgi:hypothetical protein